MIEDTSHELIGTQSSELSSSNIAASLTSTKAEVSALGETVAPKVNHENGNSTEISGGASNENDCSSLVHSNTDISSTSNLSTLIRRSAHIKMIIELRENYESDFFAQCFIREDGISQKGDPYLKLSFRDCRSQITTRLWSHHRLFSQC